MKMPVIPECSREEWLSIKVLTDEQARRVILPLSWREIPISPSDVFFGHRLYTKGRLKVMLSADGFSFGKPWLHVSMSRPDRVPSYEDMVEVKKIFIGDDRQAIQVFPKKEKHINFHPYCLHLWTCLEDDGLPDFGKYGII